MRSRFARGTIIVFLCATLLAPTLPPLSSAEAAQDDEVKRDWVVRMEIGQPSIWSLAQAHYLLGQLHDRNRDLVARRPGEDTLDPNRINASRLEILRTMLGVEAQFDESVAAKNEIELDRFRERQARKTQAQGVLVVRRAELQELDQEIMELSIRVAELKAEDSFAGTPPSEEDRQRKVTIAGEEKRLALLQEERARLATEVTSLEGAATGDVATPTLSPPALSADTGGATGALPASEALTGFVAKALENVGTPSLSASIALDNYVNIQYEIIAKQLSLLRDEVGPDERVVFLELPASLYTLDKRANRFIAQARWTVTKVFDEEPPPEVQREIICRDLRDEGKSPAAILTILKNLQGIGSGWYEFGKTPCLRWIQRNILEKSYPSLAGEKPKHQPGTWTLNEWQVEETAESTLLKALPLVEDGYSLRMAAYAIRDPEDLQPREYPITLDMIRLDQARRLAEKPTDGELIKAMAKAEEEKEGFLDNRVRTLEIIPRQSALNVNQHHAKTSYKGILGALKFLSGFGAKVNYQRQKELYENFLQQEIFASGFGKGQNSFGWTFGPQPSSRRISPGQRTTYAVLVVPKNALGLEIKAEGWAFRSTQGRERGELIESQTFMIRIPNDKTERFWVESVAYTPVRQGPVTVLLRGNYFSPQLGVLVNGVPLKRSVSISRATISDPPFTRTNSGVEGEYEITNSHEMALNFSMGPGFFGTPIITLITPERATAINSFELRINFRDRLEKLKDVSKREPMFVDRLELRPKLEFLDLQVLKPQEDCKIDGFKLARIRGKGLLPDAVISVAGGAPLPIVESEEERRLRACKGEPFAFQESTGSYTIFFQTPQQTKRWSIRCQQATRQGIEESEFEEVLPDGVEFGHKIRNYRRVPEEPSAEVDLTFVVPEARENSEATVEVSLEGSPDQKDCSVERDGKDFRGKCRIPFEGGAERDFITLRVVSTVPPPQKESLEQNGTKPKVTHFADIQLPVRPRVRVVANQRTGRPRADSRQDVKAVLRGENLSRVTGVLFGDQSAVINSMAPDVLLVQVPKVKVEPGQEVAVPVVLQTDAGALATGFFFTYEGPPEPKQ